MPTARIPTLHLHLHPPHLRNIETLLSILEWHIRAMSPQEETQDQYCRWEFDDHIQAAAYQLDYEVVDVGLAVFTTRTIGEVLCMTA